MSTLALIETDCEIADGPLSEDELLYLRSSRKDDDYTPAPAVDPVQERFSDKQLRWLGPFLKCEQAPEATSLFEIMSTHPVYLARPGQGCERSAIEALIQYCSEKGLSWGSLKVAAEDWLAKLDDGHFTGMVGKRKPR